MVSIGSRYRERLTAAPINDQATIGVMSVVQSTQDYLNGLVANYKSLAGQSTFASMERVWDETHPGPPYTTGGAFLSAKSTIPSLTVEGTGSYLSEDPHQYRNGYLNYVGGFQSAGTMWNDPRTDADYFDIGLDTTKTEFFPLQSNTDPEIWNKTQPKISEAGLGLFLAEARDTPRMMRTSAKGFHDIWKAIGGSSKGSLMSPKGAAEHFINHQFGWRPFVKDLLDFNRVYHNSKDYMDRIKRNNNTWVKRRRVLKHLESEVIVFDSPSDWGSGWYTHPADWMIMTMFKNKRYQVINRVYTEEWSEGSFKYYRPEFDDRSPASAGLYGNIQRQLSLYGAQINPSLVYKATPWTWLIDWFSDVGKSIDNASNIAADSSVCKYLYLMQSQRREITARQTALTAQSGTPFEAEWSRKASTKRRRGNVSPYGLNLGWGDLSPTQLTILGALGITRARPR